MFDLNRHKRIVHILRCGVVKIQEQSVIHQAILHVIDDKLGLVVSHSKHKILVVKPDPHPGR